MFQNTAPPTVLEIELGTRNISFVIAVVKSVINHLILFVISIRQQPAVTICIGIAPIFRKTIIGINGSTCFIFQNTAPSQSGNSEIGIRVSEFGTRNSYSELGT